MPKRIGISFIILICLIIIIPISIVRGCNWQLNENEDEKDSENTNYIVKVKMKDGKITRMPLNEYLIGVVAAEMPASFEKEALKAQAVAARTYTIKRIVGLGGKINKDHPDADICTEPAHCQAWISQEEMKKNWGWLGFYKYYKKIKEAVSSTENQVLVYRESLIDPLYFSSCGNFRTEDASEVWQEKEPYLKSVECTWEDENRYSNKETVIKLEKVAELIKMTPEESLILKLKPTIKASRYTVSGRVGGLIIGSKVVSASELRSLFKLPSTNVNWKIEKGKVYFTTKGYGHGVGLCQYGSNGLAKRGKTYKDILQTYYQNVNIRKMT